jgi:putative SOS response-associated peptidase YedK
VCGRFVTASSPALLAERFGVDEVAIEGETEPNYNVAPREQVSVVRERDGRRVLSRLRWGLVPSWAKDPSIGDRMINARAEGLATKPAYKRSFAKKRCIIPADGFYEWRVIAPPATPKGRPKKQPAFIHRRDGEPMAFAGLWDVWRVPDGLEIDGVGFDRWLRSCVIVTTRANDLLAPLHDRMPVLLPEAAWSSWLDPANDDVASLAELLVPAPDAELELWPVSTAVNKAANFGPELVKPVEPAPDHS